MRSLGKIFLFLVAVLFSGALAAPQAWHLIQSLPSGWFHGGIGHLQGMPFHRYLSRSLQVAAIVLLWPLVRSLRITHLAELGLRHDPAPGRNLLAGAAVGMGCALFLESVFLLSGAFSLRYAWPTSLGQALPRILTTAVVVALIEEFIFRGVILGFLRREMRPGIAVPVSAVVFSALHFMSLPKASVENPEWWSGFSFLSSLGSALPPFPVLCWTFLTLFAAGSLLGWMVVRTRSLWSSIGLHASWILGQQVFNAVAVFAAIPQDSFLPFIGPSQCYGMVPVGLVPLASLLIAGILAVLLLKNHTGGFVDHPTRRG